MAEKTQAEVEGHVGFIHLSDPESRNALVPEMMEAIVSGLERFDADPEVRCVVIAGSEKGFASGADIAAAQDPRFGDNLRHSTVSFWKRFSAIETPVVAAVSGWALGAGCELALACDLLVTSDVAVFGQPEVTLGLIPGGGATQRLARTIGKQRTMELILTGRRFDGDQAREWGLANVVTKKKGAWLVEARVLAQQVAAGPPLATRAAKRAVLAAYEGPMTAAIDADRKLYDEVMATEDRVEAMEAFMEKRAPRFEGR